MPFFTEARVRQSYLEEIRTPLGATLAAAFEQGAVFNPVASLERSTQLDEAMRGRPIVSTGPLLVPMIVGREPIDSPIVDAATAKSRVDEFGLDLDVPAEGIPQRALEILIERKREERVRQDTLDRGPTGWRAGSLRIGAAFAASLMDPINVASAFVPVVGQARYAAMLGRAGGVGGRALVRARVGSIEGTVGAALVEPIVYGAAISEQADYDLLDSLTNIAFGGVLGGGLHVGVGAVADTGVVQGLVRRLRRAPAPEAPPLERLLDAAAPETREALLRTAVARLAEGRAVDVEALARLDPVLRGETPGATGGVDIDLARLAGETAVAAVPATLTRLPSSSSLFLPSAPTADDMARFGRVESVKLEDARATQNRMQWEQFEAGKHPPPLIDGYVDKPVAVRREDGEYLIFDGHHRIVSAINSSRSAMDMYVIDARQYAPDAAGIKPRPSAMSDDELLRELRELGPGVPSPARAGGEPVAPSRLTARAADTPIPAGQWSDVVANARLGAVSAMADADAARAADAAIAARSTDAQEARAVQEETDAALADIDHIAGADPVLKAAVDTEMAAADLTADAAAYGRAGEAMASCMLRRGVT